MQLYHLRKLGRVTSGKLWVLRTGTLEASGGWNSVQVGTGTKLPLTTNPSFL